jgi:hypothetical protein
MNLKFRLCCLVAVALCCAPSLFASIVGYDIQITTAYDFSDPFPNFIGGGTPSPDTSFVQIANAGTTTFVGSIGTVAVSNGGPDWSFSVTNFTLNPGQSISIAIGDEASNQGGFNGLLGTQVFLTGLFDNTEAVNLFVYDMDIHSGSPRVSPCDGIQTDAFVLQGGSPTGCDNGDDFEVSQAWGHYEFSEQVGVPEPGSLLLLGGGALSGFAALRRKLL